MAPSTEMSNHALPRHSSDPAVAANTPDQKTGPRGVGIYLGVKNRPEVSLSRTSLREFPRADVAFGGPDIYYVNGGPPLTRYGIIIGFLVLQTTAASRLFVRAALSLTLRASMSTNYNKYQLTGRGRYYDVVETCSRAVPVTFLTNVGGSDR